MGDQDPEPVARRSPIPSWRTSPPSLGVRLGWLGIASAALDLGAVYWKTPVYQLPISHWFLLRFNQGAR